MHPEQRTGKGRSNGHDLAHNFLNDLLCVRASFPVEPNFQLRIGSVEDEKEEH